MNRLEPICASGMHCTTCRDREGGRAIRQQWVRLLRLRAEVDFECPYAKKWGYAPMRGLGDLVAKVTKAVGIKPCGGCRKRQEKLNKLVPFNAASSKNGEPVPPDGTGSAGAGGGTA